MSLVVLVNFDPMYSRDRDDGHVISFGAWMTSSKEIIILASGKDELISSGFKSPNLGEYNLQVPRVTSLTWNSTLYSARRWSKAEFLK
jgi:hypothetical protein